jgi:hypothetical protein
VSSSTPVNAPLGTVATATATCPAGKSILGGGTTVAVSVSTQANRVQRTEDYPSAPDAWTGTVVVTSGLVGASATVTAYAICSP